MVDKSWSPGQRVTGRLSTGGASWRDLGRHRLRDLAARRAGVGVGVGRDRHRVPSAAVVGAGPPQPARGACPRSSAVTTKSTRWQPTWSTAPVVTLVGAGGVGKTRLALAVAGLLADAVPRRCVVRRPQHRERSRGDPVGGTRRIGVREDPSRRLERASSLICSPTSPLCIVFDNCEHLVEACAPVVTTLVEASADINVLATSREPLDVYAR